VVVTQIGGRPDVDQITAHAREHLGAVSTQAVYDCVVGVEPPDLGGFVIDEAEITFWGLCPE
jgi:hypothetical protein